MARRRDPNRPQPRAATRLAPTSIPRQNAEHGALDAVAALIRICLAVGITVSLYVVGALQASVDWVAYGLAALLVALSGGVVIAARYGYSSKVLSACAISLEVVLLAEWIRVLGRLGLEVDVSSLFLLTYVPVLVAALKHGPLGSVLAAALAIVAYLARVGGVAVLVRRLLFEMGLTYFVPLVVVAALMGWLVSVAEAERRRRAERDEELFEFRHTLVLAREMRLAIRPELVPALPGLELAVRQADADTALGGGDFCAIIRAGPTKYAIGVADVAGKTLAGLATVPLAYAAFWVASHHHEKPEACMDDVDSLLGSATQPESFVALFIGFYDAATGVLGYCNAGQPDGLLIRGGTVQRLVRGGPAVGAVPADDHASYEGGEVRLEPGDLVVIGSDGVLGGPDAAERVSTLARGIPDLQRLADAILGGANPEDDRALVLLRRLAPGSDG